LIHFHKRYYYKKNCRHAINIDSLKLEEIEL